MSGCFGEEVDNIVSEGDVVFFPSWLRHKTGYNDTNDRRLTLTMNITPDYKAYAKNPPIL